MERTIEGTIKELKDREEIEIWGDRKKDDEVFYVARSKLSLECKQNHVSIDGKSFREMIQKAIETGKGEVQKKFKSIVGREDEGGLEIYYEQYSRFKTYHGLARVRLNFVDNGPKLNVRYWGRAYWGEWN